MLSKTWTEMEDDVKLRGNFYYNDGILRLTNRALSLGIQELENEEIPTALAAMRAMFPLFFHRDLRRGPFVFTLTDLHQSNIFVDEEWHITSLVDWEWGCSLPIEMLQPPHWLTNKSVDQIMAEEYNKARVEFMHVLAEEEAEADQRGDYASNNKAIRHHERGLGCGDILVHPRPVQPNRPFRPVQQTHPTNPHGEVSRHQCLPPNHAVVLDAGYRGRRDAQAGR
ncbi:hypothetical protein ACJ73_02315 [Blastomyces percursus]|uniref:Aminoglycoside phosphotransferase domain-containing protein n=1 Tax=Blastomyces percursus TaxID=1658174 RepID=A0A1J9QCQ3_9EURO|nr:hypothetical protein ACJ73_02315 [Blastomyces percursus]